MNNFKNYIFDLGGVLLDINMQNALDEFRALGIPKEELRYDIGETAKIMQNYQLGLLTTDEFCDAIISRCKAGATTPKNSDVIALCHHASKLPMPGTPPSSIFPNASWTPYGH